MMIMMMSRMRGHGSLDFETRKALCFFLATQTTRNSMEILLLAWCGTHADIPRVVVQAVNKLCVSLLCLRVVQQ